MLLTDWFTIIAILLAVLAFFSQAERKILLLKTKDWQRWVSGLILLLYIPFLLYYEKMALVFNCLNQSPFRFDSRFLPMPSDWAFLLTFITIGSWVWWFSVRLKRVEPNQYLMNHYLKSINTMPFEDLFRLFIKYEETQLEKASNFNLYGSLLTNETFFNSAINHNPNLFLGIINNLDAPIILASRLPVVIRDRVNSIAAEQRRLGVMSAYNYEPIFHDKWPKEELLLFHLTDCYFALMKRCIEANAFDSNEFGMLNSFSETMFSGILKSICIPEGVDFNKEIPTYYHKLLSNTLSAFKEWILLANKQNREFHIIEHFITLYSNCLIKLMKYNEDIVSDKYLKIQLNSFLRTYFDDILNDVHQIRTKIEDKLVSTIPINFQEKAYYKTRFNTCWEYSDDAIFGGDSGVLKHERPKRDRFIKNVVEKIRNS